MLLSLEYAILEFLAIIVTFLIVGKYVQIPIWKRIVLAFLAILSGAIGTKLMSFIESNQIEGGSFYGAVFFSPFLMILWGRILHIPTRTTLDISAPGECAVLAAMKLECLHNGCCQGIVLEQDAAGTVLRRFPSQIVESVFGLLLALLFIYIIKKRKFQGKVYLLYMTLYGLGRFILNQYRDATPWILNMASGTFWSILAFLFGSLMLYIPYLRKTAIEERKQARSNVNNKKRH